ncbi:hypothetical protein I4U23_011329 [Adineta vaga]|nr:hypothetical protein I4U23_011329 [Adineta vaga]
MIRGRHLAVRLAKFIKHELLDLNIQNKVRSITTDNAPNIVSAVFKLGIGEHYSCMAHNLHLMVKSILFPTEKKKKSSSFTSASITNQQSNDHSTDDDDESSNDYATSEEDSTNNYIDQGDDTSTSNSEDSSAEEEYSTSESEEDDNEILSTDAPIDKTILRMRCLIKKVRSLIGLVHHSVPVDEYVQEEAKIKNLSGQ